MGQKSDILLKDRGIATAEPVSYETPISQSNYMVKETQSVEKPGYRTNPPSMLGQSQWTPSVQTTEQQIKESLRQRRNYDRNIE